ncbi:MAG: hypothetical protein AAFY65_03355 [Pseudomonadota bacterium]
MPRGHHILAHALRSVWARLPLTGLLLLGFTTADVAAYAVLDWLSDAGFLVHLLIGMLMLVPIGIVASIWHRTVLRPDLPPMNFKIALRYTVAWFVLGVILFLMLSPFAAIAYGLYWLLLLADPYLLDPILMQILLDWGAGGGAVLAVATIPFLWLLYRCGLGLPHLALGQGPMGVRDSRHRTKPLARACAELAVLAGLAQWALVSATAAVPLPDPSDVPPGATDWPLLLFEVSASANYGVIVIVGAALLTELYRRSDPTYCPTTDSAGRLTPPTEP